MPFELGLAVGMALEQGGHEWRVLETVSHRLNHSLSDVDGYDPAIHDGTVTGMLDALLDVFDNRPNPPLRTATDLMGVYRGLRRFRSTLPETVYRPNAFRRLVVAARGLVQERVGPPLP